MSMNKFIKPDLVFFSSHLSIPILPSFALNCIWMSLRSCICDFFPHFAGCCKLYIQVYYFEQTSSNNELMDKKNQRKDPILQTGGEY